MRALVSLFKQDALLSWRNGLVLVTGITLVVIVALYWTLPLMLPGELELGGEQLYLDHTTDGSVKSYLTTQGVAADLFVETREELVAEIQGSQGVTGVVVTGRKGILEFELIYRHVPDQKVVNILTAAMETLDAAVSGTRLGGQIRTETLRPQAEPLRSNQSLVAVMLAFEVMILGFLFVAVVVFGEKTEGSLRAYRVTPSGIANYVISKTAVFTLMSTLYGIVMVVATLGLVSGLTRLVPVLLLSCGLMTLLGLGVAVFFHNLSEWFVPGVLVLGINMLAILPYQIPTLNLQWLTVLPGYAVIFGVTEILFPTGKVGFMGPMYLTLGLWFVGAAVFAGLAVRRTMSREA